MVVPLAGRVIAAVVGGLLVIVAARSVIGTIIVPGPTGSWFIRSVDKAVDATYQMATKPIKENYRTRDRILASEAAVILLVQLIAWLGLFFIGFALLLWPFVHGGITSAFTIVGPAVWFIGRPTPRGLRPRPMENCPRL